MSDYRAKWMDPDFRRDPKTSRWCEVCQRDLKPGQPHRRILFRFDRYEAVHAEDWELAMPPDHSGEGWIEGKIGMDCAKRLGLEWSRPPAEEVKSDVETRC